MGQGVLKGAAIKIEFLDTKEPELLLTKSKHIVPR